MRAIDYHDSFLTAEPVLLPRFITAETPDEDLPDHPVVMAKLADKCPICRDHLYGTYDPSERQVRSVKCWNMNCMWAGEDENAHTN